MPPRPAVLTKRTLDKDLDKITHAEDVAKHVLRRLVAPGLGLIFVGLAMLFAGVYVFDRPGAMLVVAAAALAYYYMAMNIGANDVTNNVGAAVGARAMTMGQALVIAAIFEVLGATVVDGEVVKTISANIVDAVQVPPVLLGWIMMAALMAAALWINLATWMNAPVSTTHAIVGAVIGAEHLSRRAGTGELAGDAGDHLELDHLATDRRADRCRAALSRQDADHLSRRQDRGRAALGAGAGRGDG